MANLQFALETGAVAGTVGGPKTILQLVAPANQRVKVLGWGVTFDGILTTGQPIDIKVVRQTTAGTMTALTPVNTNAVAETIQSTAQVNATAEPTTGTLVYYEGSVHPQQGIIVQLPYGQEYICPGGGRIGIVVNIPGGQSGVNARVHMYCEE